MKKWCEHIHSAKNGRYYINGVMVGDGKMKWAGYDAPWDICPVRGCHAPRPVEKTLAEKFRDCGSRRQTNTISDATDFYQELAQIAKEHYEREWK